MKKNLLLILAVISMPSFADKICYDLKDVMEDEKMGKSNICHIPELKMCLFTSDHDWYTHTFQVPCKQFKVVDNLAKQKYLSPKIIK